MFTFREAKQRLATRNIRLIRDTDWNVFVAQPHYDAPWVVESDDVEDVYFMAVKEHKIDLENGVA